MTISLAFLAPSLVKAAVEGRLPRGIGLARLIEAPPEGIGSIACSASRPEPGAHLLAGGSWYTPVASAARSCDAIDIDRVD
jgi:hypothetical protein